MSDIIQFLLSESDGRIYRNIGSWLQDNILNYLSKDVKNNGDIEIERKSMDDVGRPENIHNVTFQILSISNSYPSSRMVGKVLHWKHLCFLKPDLCTVWSPWICFHVVNVMKSWVPTDVNAYLTDLDTFIFTHRVYDDCNKLVFECPNAIRSREKWQDCFKRLRQSELGRGKRNAKHFTGETDIFVRFSRHICFLFLLLLYSANFVDIYSPDTNFAVWFPDDQCGDGSIRKPPRTLSHQ